MRDGRVVSACFVFFRSAADCYEKSWNETLICLQLLPVHWLEFFVKINNWTNKQFGSQSSTSLMWSITVERNQSFSLYLMETILKRKQQEFCVKINNSANKQFDSQSSTSLMWSITVERSQSSSLYLMETILKRKQKNSVASYNWFVAVLPFLKTKCLFLHLIYVRKSK